MRTVLFTGFPGFLGSALVPRLLTGNPDRTALCVVQERYLDEARRRAEALATDHPGLRDRLRLAVGDITRPDLGLAAPETARRETVEIHHLAALYDVTAPRERSERINVDGTRRVLDFARSCSGLERIHYVSTCYVSGRYPGVFTESEPLASAGPFNNVYEETKHRAELEVRERMEEGLPATIYRPAIVVGDSDTGRTMKLDGPYFVVRFLLRQPGAAVMPVVGDPDRVRVNVVPRDFVADAIVHLGGLEASVGRTYQLADPTPLTVSEMLDEVQHALNKPVLRVPLPHGLARRALASLPGLESWIGIPAEALDYFTHPTLYDPARALADLEGSGIRPPPFSSYADRLVDFVRENSSMSAEAMA